MPPPPPDLSFLEHDLVHLEKRRESAHGASRSRSRSRSRRRSRSRSRSRSSGGGGDGNDAATAAADDAAENNQPGEPRSLGAEQDSGGDGDGDGDGDGGSNSRLDVIYACQSDCNREPLVRRLIDR